MANLETLKPFQKGHKKLGGRKKGVPNKNSHSLSNLFIATAERLGSDGRGTGGHVGYFTSVLKNEPRLAARLWVATLRHEHKHPPKDLAQRELIRILQSADLTLEEKVFLERIWEKVTGTRYLF